MIKLLFGKSILKKYLYKVLKIKTKSVAIFISKYLFCYRIK